MARRDRQAPFGIQCDFGGPSKHDFLMENQGGRTPP
jgi:hypothetical protein